MNALGSGHPETLALKERLVRWATTGITATVIQWLVSLLLDSRMESEFWPGTLAWIVSGQFAFVMHHTFTWRDRHRGDTEGWRLVKAVGWRWLKFLVVNITAGLITGAVQAWWLSAQDWTDSRTIALLVGAIVASPCNYLLLNFVVFRNDEPPT